ncbi:MAG: CRISPR-associated endonuclease Cas2 [Chitinispirillales bacterium]|jgi:CRISPR-associated protein Cas2|nr:CRISPR-associated endonuclease Cas2 [Chitinispirillales bacterium]
MLIVSYDITDNKLRAKFAKTLIKQGGIRLQLSVFELNNTSRVLENLKIRIENYYSKKFEGGDSVLIFETDEQKTIKYGNAIHRDKDLVFFP